MRTRRHAVVLLLAGGALLAGCGGGDDEKDGGSLRQGAPATATIDVPAATGDVFSGTGYALHLTGRWSDVTAQTRKITSVAGLDRAIAKPRDGARGATNVNVIREANPAKLSLERVVVVYRAGLLRAGKTGMTGTVPIALGTKPALSYTFHSASPDGAPLRERQVVALHGALSYVITLASGPREFRAGNRDFLSMLSTWRWG